VPMRFSGSQGFHLLTTPVHRLRLVIGGIRALMVPLGQLGHEAKAASSGRTQVGGQRPRRRSPSQAIPSASARGSASPPCCTPGDRP
jgi:hypothetical protein